MRPLVFVPAIAATAIVVACSSSSRSTDAGPPILGAYDPTPFGGSRPVELYVPSKYDPSKPAPLVILLHGYGASGIEEDGYLGLRAVAEENTVLYAHPDGTVDATGNKFWNATDACCNFYGSKVDDSSYLSSLVTEIKTRYSVDPKRVYFVGHSNGAFMSYRMACDHADVIAGIMSLAGAMWLDTSKCKASGPVSVLEVHGTADMSVLYDGGTSTSSNDAGLMASVAPYPGAKTSVADWATIDDCASPPNTSLPNLDLDGTIAGAETSVTQYKTGCRSQSEVDLWSIDGGMHVPGFNTTFGPKVFAFLLAHPKP